MCPFILHCVIYYFWDCYTTLQDWCNFISSYRMPSVLSLTPAVQWSSLAVQLTTAHSPFEQCCPPHWTSCCCPACPSEWSLTDRRAWAKCHTGWRTCATPRCRLWVKLYHPGDSALSAGGAEEGIYKSIYPQNMAFVYVENNSPYRTQIHSYIRLRKSTYRSITLK